jgi:hypothetical protein
VTLFDLVMILSLFLDKTNAYVDAMYRPQSPEPAEWDRFEADANRFLRKWGLHSYPEDKKKSDTVYTYNFVTEVADRLWVRANCPETWSLNSLPGHAEAERNGDFANAHLKWARGVRSLEVREDRLAQIDDYIRGLEARRDLWNDLRCATSPYWNVWDRRRKAGALLNLLGPDAFWRGQMPDPAPYESFPLIGR